MFKISGLITPPCGTPSVVGVKPTPASTTPALSQPAIIFRAGNIPSAERR
jgi:hypothetical protein